MQREGSWEGTVTEQFDQTSFLCAGADWAEDLPVGRILAWRLCRQLVLLKEKLVPLWSTPNYPGRFCILLQIIFQRNALNIFSFDVMCINL